MTGEVLHIPREYTAIAEFIACFVYILFSKRRIKGPKFAVLSIVMFVVILAFQLWADSWPIQLWIIGMVMAVSLMFFYIYISAEKDMFKSGYITVMAFILAEFVASFQWQMDYFIFEQRPRIEILSWLLMIAIYALLFFLVYLLENRYKKRFYNMKIRRNDFIAVLVMGIIIFGISNFSFLNIDTPISGRYPLEIFYIRTLVDLAGIVFLYSQREHQYAATTKLELFTMKTLFEKQYEQYYLSMISNEVINQKYHDLKNHIAVIRNEVDHHKRQKHIDDLEQAIKVYENQFQTGNHVLDIILNSKSNQLNNHSINFTCVADGKLLDIVSDMDLVSIFGNALDNAIESVKDIEIIEKRLIKLAVFAKDDFILIRIENYFQNSLKYELGHLVTTKKDATYHGYGIKSIKMTVKKYRGTVKIDTNSNWFKLLILIPTK